MADSSTVVLTGVVHGSDHMMARNVYEDVFADAGITLREEPEIIDYSRIGLLDEITLTVDVADMDDAFWAIARAQEQLRARCDFSKLQPASPAAERTTVVVNMFGGPGAGKTPAAFEVAEKLKKAGYLVEYAPEYAKELVWDLNDPKASATQRAFAADMLSGRYESQKALYSEQLRRVERCIGQCDFVVTDSPPILGAAYLKEDYPQQREDFERIALSDFNGMRSFNMVVKRSGGYEQAGRVQGPDEAAAIDESVKGLLDRHDIYYGTYDHSQIDQAIENMQKTRARFARHDEARATLRLTTDADSREHGLLGLNSSREGKDMSYKFESANKGTVEISISGEHTDGTFDVDVSYALDTPRGHEGNATVFEEIDAGSVDDIIQWLVDEGVEFESMQSCAFNRAYIASAMLDGDATEQELLDEAANWTEVDIAHQLDSIEFATQKQAETMGKGSIEADKGGLEPQKGAVINMAEEVAGQQASVQREYERVTMPNKGYQGRDLFRSFTGRDGNDYIQVKFPPHTPEVVNVDGETIDISNATMIVPGGEPVAVQAPHGSLGVRTGSVTQWNNDAAYKSVSFPKTNKDGEPWNVEVRLEQGHWEHPDAQGTARGQWVKEEPVVNRVAIAEISPAMQVYRAERSDYARTQRSAEREQTRVEDYSKDALAQEHGKLAGAKSVDAPKGASYAKTIAPGPAGRIDAAANPASDEKVMANQAKSLSQGIAVKPALTTAL